MLEGIRWAVLPFHDLVLSVEEDPLGGPLLADTLHRVGVTFLVFAGHLRFQEDLFLVEVVEALSELVAGAIAGALVALD